MGAPGPTWDGDPGQAMQTAAAEGHYRDRGSSTMRSSSLGSRFRFFPSSAAATAAAAAAAADWEGGKAAGRAAGAAAAAATTAEAGY